MDEIAEIGIELVVPPPAVENMPAPIIAPDVRLVDPMMPKPEFACVMT